MNCKNVEPLLSLYVGRDLEEEHSRLVAAHLQSCTECTLAADEYAGARQLLQGYEPPLFGDEIYAGIREQVLTEIRARVSRTRTARYPLAVVFTIGPAADEMDNSGATACDISDCSILESQTFAPTAK